MNTDYCQNKMLIYCALWIMYKIKIQNGVNDVPQKLKLD